MQTARERQPRTSTGASPAPSRGWTRLLVALYVVVVALGAGALLEFAARKLNTAGYIRSDSPNLVYELRPSFREHNAAGQRDLPYALVPPPGTFRVAGVGDSYTYGVGVAPDRNYLAVAERQLAQRELASKVEIINFGRPGYNTAMEAVLLEEQVLAWHPDLVILQFCRNDMRLPNFIQTQRSGIVARSFALHAFLSGAARLAPHFVKSDLMGYHFDGDVFPVPGLEHVPLVDGNPIGNPKQVPEQYRSWVGPAGVQAALRRIAETARAHGVPVVVLLGWGDHDQDATEWARSVGLSVLDVGPAVHRHLATTGKPFESLWVKPPVDTHPNIEGHEVIAALVADAIAARVPAAGTTPPR